jgi:hypothetical protein
VVRGKKEETPGKVEIEDIKMEPSIILLFSGQIIGTQLSITYLLLLFLSPEAQCYLLTIFSFIVLFYFFFKILIINNNKKKSLNNSNGRPPLDTSPVLLHPYKTCSCLFRGHPTPHLLHLKSKINPKDLGFLWFKFKT